MKRLPHLGEVVFDRWFPFWGNGRVKVVLKTRLRILFADGELRTYDHAHCQFLEPV